MDRVSQAPPDSKHEMGWFMAGVGGYFLSGGVQGVLFPWILVVVLQESADRVGIGQMASMLPMLLLTLFGGVTADRSELRRLLMRLQLASAAAPLALAALILAGHLTYEIMIAYVLVLSALGAFTMPARDSLLTRVAQRVPGGSIQQTVAAATGAQFLAQVVGMLIGGAARIVGAPVLLVGQSLSLIFSAFATKNVQPAPSAARSSHPDQRRSRVAEIREGIDAVWHDESVRPVVLLMFFAGILFVGVIMVLFPIMVRDIYAGDSFQIALVNVFFFGGIGFSSAVQSRLRPIRRQGRAVMLSMLTGSTVMMLMHFGPPIWLFFGLALAWGLAAGVSMSQSRAIVQERTTDLTRARVLSVYQLGTMGGGPIGALATGYVIEWLGPLDAVLLPAGCMIVLWLSVFLFTGLWRVQAPAHRAPAPEPAD